MTDKPDKPDPAALDLPDVTTGKLGGVTASQSAVEKTLAGNGTVDDADTVLAQLLGKKPRAREIVMVVDEDCLDEHERLTAEVRAAELDHQIADTAGDDETDNEKRDRLADVRKKQKALDAARGRLDEYESGLLDRGALRKFKFRAIGSDAYDDLVSAHPPSKKEIDRAQKAGQPAPTTSAESFPPALVAACIVEPALKPEQVAVLFKSGTWNGAELGTLYMCCVDVNQTIRNVSLGKDSGATTPSGR